MSLRQRPGRETGANFNGLLKLYTINLIQKAADSLRSRLRDNPTMLNFMLRSLFPYNAQRSLPLLVATFFAIYFSDSAAFNPVASSFVKAPKHCQAKLADLAERGSNWGYKVPSVVPYKIDDYRRLMGNAWGHMHHYCAALDEMIRQEDYAWSAEKLEWKRRNAYSAILKNFNYQLEHTKWDDSLLWFKAEVLKNRARANKLAGKSGEAIADFQSAIRTFPAYLPAYWDLAELYEDMASVELAQETLRNALPYARKDRYKQKINEKLRELSKLQHDGTQAVESSDTADSVNAE